MNRGSALAILRQLRNRLEARGIAHAAIFGSIALRGIIATAAALALLCAPAPAEAQRRHPTLEDAAANSRGFWSWDVEGQSVRSAGGLRCTARAGRFALSELSFRNEVESGGAYCHYAAPGGADLFVLVTPPRWQPADEARARRQLGTNTGRLLWAETANHDVANCKGVRNQFRWESEYETTLLLAGDERVVSVSLFTARDPDPADIAFLDEAALGSGGC